MMTFLIGLAAFILAGSIGYVVGFAFGRKYGQDEQWVEDMLALARKDAGRRDAHGRFRTTLSGSN